MTNKHVILHLINVWSVTFGSHCYMKIGSKSNLALHSLIIAWSMKINFKVDKFEMDDWTIKGDVTPLRSYILTTRKYI